MEWTEKKKRDNDQKGEIVSRLSSGQNIPERQQKKRNGRQIKIKHVEEYTGQDWASATQRNNTHRGMKRERDRERESTRERSRDHFPWWRKSVKCNSLKGV